MNFILQIKEFVRPIIARKNINRALLVTLNFLQPLLPDKLLVRIPVYGVATCDLPNSRSLSLYAEADDPIVSGLMFKGLDAYEPETMAVFRELASKAQVIYDIGANTGIYSMVAAVENPSSSVHAFEPVPRIFQRLNKNRLLNGVSNLRLDQRVVTNSNGTTTLYVPSGRMPTSSSTLKGHRLAHSELKVSTVTLDKYSQSEQISMVDLIKIDTEATEPLVLEGALGLIKASKPTIICEVLNRVKGKAIKTILDEFDYRYFWIVENGLMERSEIVGDPSFIYLNYLFVHPSRIDDISRIKYDIPENSATH